VTQDVRVEPEFNMEWVIDCVSSVIRPPLLPVLRGALGKLTDIIRVFDTEFAARPRTDN
jgi:hypothetical protein